MRRSWSEADHWLDRSTTTLAPSDRMTVWREDLPESDPPRFSVCKEFRATACSIVMLWLTPI